MSGYAFRPRAALPLANPSSNNRRTASASVPSISSARYAATASHKGSGSVTDLRMSAGLAGAGMAVTDPIGVNVVQYGVDRGTTIHHYGACPIPDARS